MAKLSSVEIGDCKCPHCHKSFKVASSNGAFVSYVLPNVTQQKPVEEKKPESSEFISYKIEADRNGKLWCDFNGKKSTSDPMDVKPNTVDYIPKGLTPGKPAEHDNLHNKSTGGTYALEYDPQSGQMMDTRPRNKK